MFDRIAPVYDVMNRVMTVGLDQRWRRITARAVVRPGDEVLDAAWAPAISRSRARVRAVASPASTSRSGCSSAPAAKRRELDWVQGDMLALPFADASFDAATVGFGVRNVADLEWSLRELARVLRPGGRLGILEITRPRGALRVFYSLWFDRLVPLLGKVLPGGAAYAYLPASVKRFPGRRRAGSAARRAGFEDVRCGRSRAASSRCTQGASE